MVGSSERGDHTPSDLDELTHKELCILYQETAANIHFAKTQQWRTFGATLLMMVVLLGIVKFVSHQAGYMQLITSSVILITLTAITVLIIYQFWQHTEARKLAAIDHYCSSLFRKIRGYKHKREASIHRYMLLAFMVIGLILGAAITYSGMLRVVLRQ